MQLKALYEHLVFLEHHLTVYVESYVDFLLFGFLGFFYV